MLKTITTVAIALLSIASTASAQNNFTFANRTVLTPGTEQAPFVMTPRLPYQPVADTRASRATFTFSGLVRLRRTMSITPGIHTLRKSPAILGLSTRSST